jgi:hypothetical protein
MARPAGSQNKDKPFREALDGKPAQAIIGGDDDDPAVALVHRIERVIVRPPNPDG